MSQITEKKLHIMRKHNGKFSRIIALVMAFSCIFSLPSIPCIYAPLSRVPRSNIIITARSRAI